MEALLNQTDSPPGGPPLSDVVGSGPDELASATPTFLSKSEQEHIEFYRSYDVMTGVRIAATLGGFFGLMVLLVVYKSKCKSKSLSDEQLNAAAAVAEAAAAAGQDDDQLAAALDAFFAPRRSLGNMSAPAPATIQYTNLETPACFYYQRGKSLPGSALRFQYRANASCFSLDDRPTSPLTPGAAVEEEEEEDSVLADADPCCYHQYLTVPSGARARRLSSITCSSSDTSYLERRGSAVELGLPAPPPFKGSCLASTMPEEPWDFYYPIDIQVIQPTPEASPCGSEHTLYHVADSLVPPRMAPLASISTCDDYPDIDTHSVGSDSVFLDDDDLDTEDEVEGFSTDSEDDQLLCIPFSQHFLQVPIASSSAGRWVAGTSFQPKRRLSAPGGNHVPPPCATISAVVATTDAPSSSRSCELLKRPGIPENQLVRRPPFPLPPLHSSASDSDSDSDSSTPRGSVTTLLKPVPLKLCDASNALLRPPSIPLQDRDVHVDNKNYSWFQETLF